MPQSNLLPVNIWDSKLLVKLWRIKSFVDKEIVLFRRKTLDITGKGCSWKNCVYYVTYTNWYERECVCFTTNMKMWNALLLKIQNIMQARQNKNCARWWTFAIKHRINNITLSIVIYFWRVHNILFTHICYVIITKTTRI